MNLRGSNRAGMRSQCSCKVTSLRSRFGVGVLADLLRIFGVPFPENISGGLLLLFCFFCFVINLRGEIKIQLDVNLWSLER